MTTSRSVRPAPTIRPAAAPGHPEARVASVTVFQIATSRVVNSLISASRVATSAVATTNPAVIASTPVGRETGGVER